MMLACLFDDFAYSCDYYTSQTTVNNGYGCTHQDQEEIDFDQYMGKNHGKCSCNSCPLGCEADQEAWVRAENVDWDGFDADQEGGVAEGEYILVRFDSEASADKRAAVINYKKRINRFNRDYLIGLSKLLAEHPDEPASKIFFRLERPKTIAYVDENTTKNRRCNRCGNVVLKETEKMDGAYPYACVYCDENMYEIETSTGDTHGADEFVALCYAALNLSLDQ